MVPSNENVTEQREGERKDTSFREILASYMSSLYPVDTVLPIGSSYGEFPFIVFRSCGLGEVRSKMFADKYLLTSNELNVLNLILSH